MCDFNQYFYFLIYYEITFKYEEYVKKKIFLLFC